MRTTLDPVFFTRARSWLIAPALAALLVLGGCAGSGGPQRVWDAQAVPESGSSQIRLQAKNSDGSTSTVGYVRRDQVVQYREMVQQIAGTANQAVSKVLITDKDQVNAFAGFDKNGNPFVGITLKMLALISDDQDALAALVGHEIAHLKLNHSAQKAAFNQGAEAVATIAGILLQVAGVPMARTATSLGKGVVVAAYSRDNESEADEMGIRLAYQSGYDPHGAVRLFQKLEKASSGFAIPFLNTHPFSSDRIETMTAVAAELQSGDSARPSNVASEPRNAQAGGGTCASESGWVPCDSLARPSADPTPGSAVQQLWGVRFEQSSHGFVRVAYVTPGTATSLRADDLVMSCRDNNQVERPISDLTSLSQCGNVVGNYLFRVNRNGVITGADIRG